MREYFIKKYDSNKKNWTLLRCIGMVHPRGFEPLTARFVAEYSIQLSYGCVAVNTLNK